MSGSNLRETSGAMVARIEPLNKKLNELLTEGVLTEEYVLDNIPSLLETCAAASTLLS